MKAPSSYAGVHTVHKGDRKGRPYKMRDSYPKTLISSLKSSVLYNITKLQELYFLKGTKILIFTA